MRVGRRTAFKIVWVALILIFTAGSQFCHFKTFYSCLCTEKIQGPALALKNYDYYPRNILEVLLKKKKKLIFIHMRLKMNKCQQQTSAHAAEGSRAQGQPVTPRQGGQS